jgi:hypothetical protein
MARVLHFGALRLPVGAACVISRVHVRNWSLHTGILEVPCQISIAPKDNITKQELLHSPRLILVDWPNGIAWHRDEILAKFLV